MLFGIQDFAGMAKILPMLMSLALHGRSSDTNLCQHFSPESVAILELKPSIRYVHIKPNDNRDFRFNYETFQIGYDDSHLIDKLNSHKFKSDLPSKVLIHGFMDKWPMKDKKNWIDHILKELTISTTVNGNRGYNVFVLSFDHHDIIRAGGLMKAYTKIALTVPSLGRYLGKFLFQLTKFRSDVNLSTFHIIGHSLGAHLAGFTGKTVQQLSDGELKLGYISGLDPAGPCFEDNEPTMRLDSTDATRVDVIHSNMGGFGITKSIGHVDITLNNGVMQPGVIGAIGAHGYSLPRLFHHHQQDCQLIAYKCPDKEHYDSGNCPPCDDGHHQQEHDDGDGDVDENCIVYKHWPDIYQPSEKNLQDPRNEWMKNPTKTLSYFSTTRGSEPYCAHILQMRVKSEFDLGSAVAIELRSKQRSKHITIYRSNMDLEHEIRHKDDTNIVSERVHYYTGLVIYDDVTFSPITTAIMFVRNLKEMSKKSLDSETNRNPIEIWIDYRSNASAKIRKSLSTRLRTVNIDKSHVIFEKYE